MSSSTPPDQNVSSKLDAACRNRRTRITLSKMTAHDQKDASNRTNITSLTMASDCKNSPMIERSCEIEPARGRVSIALGCILSALYGVNLDNSWRQRGLLPRLATTAEDQAGRGGSSASADRDAGTRCGSACGRAASAARILPAAGTAR